MDSTVTASVTDLDMDLVLATHSVVSTMDSTDHSSDMDSVTHTSGNRHSSPSGELFFIFVFNISLFLPKYIP